MNPFLFLTLSFVAQFSKDCGNPTVSCAEVHVAAYTHQVTVSWGGESITIPYTGSYSTDGTNHLWIILSPNGQPDVIHFENNETRWRYLSSYK